MCGQWGQRALHPHHAEQRDWFSHELNQVGNLVASGTLVDNKRHVRIRAEGRRDKKSSAICCQSHHLCSFSPAFSVGHFTRASVPHNIQCYSPEAGQRAQGRVSKKKRHQSAHLVSSAFSGIGASARRRACSLDLVRFVEFYCRFLFFFFSEV